MEISQFDTIDYLKNGTRKQQEAYHVLITNSIFDPVKEFNPILVGTIPINIDIEESDLDIICYSADLDKFINTATESFQNKAGFSIRETFVGEIKTVIARFSLESFPVELFCQPIPVKQQAGYRHMITEHQVLQKRGEMFRQQILELKKKGFKTEPAFAQLLGLTGDPYVSVLNYRIS